MASEAVDCLLVLQGDGKNQPVSQQKARCSPNRPPAARALGTIARPAFKQVGFCEMLFPEAQRNATNRRRPPALPEPCIGNDKQEGCKNERINAREEARVWACSSYETTLQGVATRAARITHTSSLHLGLRLASAWLDGSSGPAATLRELGTFGDQVSSGRKGRSQR